MSNALDQTQPAQVVRGWRGPQESRPLPARPFSRREADEWELRGYQVTDDAPVAVFLTCIALRLTDGRPAIVAAADGTPIGDEWDAALTMLGLDPEAAGEFDYCGAGYLGLYVFGAATQAA